MSNVTAVQSNTKNATHKAAAPYRTTILHLVGDLEANAQAREVVDLSIQTHRAGWRPLIASAGGTLVLEAERSAVRHTRLPLQSGNVLTAWRNRIKLEKLIERERPALLHAHGMAVVAVATKLAQRKTLPLLIDLTEFASVTPRSRKILQQAAAQGAVFRVPSAFMLRHLRDDFNLTTATIYRVNPGVDLVWYSAPRVTPERLHRLQSAWRLPEQANVIVTATPLGTGGGHATLIEAMAALKGVDLYAVLIGEDMNGAGIRAQIETLIAAHGLEGRVIMPETCADWPAACWLSSAVLAVNSQPRGQAPELLAAQALGRPVIVSDCGANAELVKKGETAWVIPPDEPQALAAALREAMAMSPARRIDLAVQTRDYMSDHFPMELWRDSLFGIYDSMLTRPLLTAAA